MIFQQIDFHNVADITPFEDGWRLWRIPESVCRQCDPPLMGNGMFSTGMELRFRILGDAADIHLRALPSAEGQMAYLYYGSIQGGWQHSSLPIREGRTVLHIPKPGNMEQLQRITQAHDLPFSPEVCRLVLPYGMCIFLGVEGDVAPPCAADLPRRTQLAYGSSITHGSLALATPGTYAFRMVQSLKNDLLNLGCAGACRCERPMLEWLMARKDWHYATVELGINMMDLTDAEFERRIDLATGMFADDGRPVFATSIFSTMQDGDKHRRFRDIVYKYAAPRLTHFIDGLDLMDRPDFVAQDGVHPSLEGQLLIADRWTRHVAHHLQEINL